jgi:hypothetical protein
MLFSAAERPEAALAQRLLAASAAPSHEATEHPRQFAPQSGWLGISIAAAAFQRAIPLLNAAARGSSTVAYF